MDAHLRLNLKALREHRKRLDELIAERPVSRHDILDVVLKQGIDALSHQRIAEIVKRSLVLRKVCGGQAVSHHHVHPALEHLIRHLPCRLCGIGVIPVRDDIALCIDVAEHPAQHVAFSLTVFIAHRRTGAARQLVRSIGGIIVVDVNRCLRKHPLKVRHNLLYRPALIIAGNQYCYFIHSHSQTFLLLPLPGTDCCPWHQPAPIPRRRIILICSTTSGYV